MFEDEVETFIDWVKSARPQAGVAEVLVPGEPERQRRPIGRRTPCRSTARRGSMSAI